MNGTYGNFKPCPFCGGRSLRLRVQAKGREKSSQIDAIAEAKRLWNQRYTGEDKGDAQDKA